MKLECRQIPGEAGEDDWEEVDSGADSLDAAALLAFHAYLREVGEPASSLVIQDRFGAVEYRVKL